MTESASKRCAAVDAHFYRSLTVVPPPSRLCAASLLPAKLTHLLLASNRQRVGLEDVYGGTASLSPHDLSALAAVLQTATKKVGALCAHEEGTAFTFLCPAAPTSVAAATSHAALSSTAPLFPLPLPPPSPAPQISTALCSLYVSHLAPLLPQTCNRFSPLPP